MNVIETPLAGVQVFEPDRFEDERGWFMEVWNEERYLHAGLPVRFAQTNVSLSSRGVLRGMHYQSPQEQGKLVSVLSGAVFDVLVDIRRGSPDFGRWYGLELSADNRRQLWIPEGYAHGFLALSAATLVHYACTAPYHPGSDRTLAWDDPDVGIAWPHTPAIISAKDRAAPPLARISDAELPSLRPLR
ncbi:MAG TPA: dTDP-4-dehydrorhamnose 3,5-epimerase [Longimicrobiales bacterium]|nr:dTDP-4-dehydrorhamnose 3,5-epimerase [Longimicrobiales bacterium]